MKMTKECVHVLLLTVQFPGKRVFLKCSAVQRVFYIFQQLKMNRTKQIEQLN